MKAKEELILYTIIWKQIKYQGIGSYIQANTPLELLETDEKLRMLFDKIDESLNEFEDYIKARIVELGGIIE